MRRERKMLKRMSGLLAAALVLVLMLAGCEQNNEMPVGRSLTVTVQNASDSKTIGPAGNVNISDYVITLSNGEMTIPSGYLEKGESFTVTNIPVGMWTAKVDGYVENTAAEGGYALVATATSSPTLVTEGSAATISVVLDKVIEAASGDVTITLKLPVTDFSIGSYAYVTWSITNGEITYAITNWNRALSLQVDGDQMASFTLDADNLLENGEVLNQGVWDITVTARKSRNSSANEYTGREVMRLLAGLPAEGLVDLSGMDTGEGGFDVTIDTDFGELLEFGFSLKVEPDTLVLGCLDGIPEDGSHYSFFIDDENISTEGDIWYEFIRETRNPRFIIHGVQPGNHSLMIVHNDGKPFGTSSITMQVRMPEYTEVTLEYMDVMSGYVIPEGHVNYGFMDEYGDYIQFPYTAHYEDMNGDGQVQFAEMGLAPLDYPYVDGEHVNVHIHNNSIIRVGVPGYDDSFPSLSGTDVLYVAFAEGPTDIGYTVTSGEAPYENQSMSFFSGTVQYLFPKSLERFGRTGTLFSGNTEHWIFQSIVEDDLSPEWNTEIWTSNYNIDSSIETIDFCGSPYVIENGLLMKVTQEGKELLGIMGKHISEARAALLDGDRIVFPDDLIAFRPYALAGIYRIVRDVEGGAVLVMPPGLKKLDYPLVISGDMEYFKAIIFNEGFESLGYLGGDDWSTWSGANDDNNSLKIYLPSTLKEIAQQEVSGNFSTPEFYVALAADTFDWQTLLSYDESSQDVVIYFEDEWTMGEDGIPVADKLKTTDMFLWKRDGVYVIGFDDLFFARIDYRYEYTVDGSEPAEPTEASRKLDPQKYEGSSYNGSYYVLREACPLWDVEMPLRLKIGLFSEGSGPSDTVYLTYDPS